MEKLNRNIVYRKILKLFQHEKQKIICKKCKLALLNFIYFNFWNMKTMQQWFDEYGESHQNGFNKMMHWICVPAIFFSVIGLLWSIPSQWLSDLFPANVAPYTNMATLVLLLGLIFYLRLSLGMFFGMLLVSVVVVLGIRALEIVQIAPLWQISLSIFVIAWIGQFWGHKVEGKKPSFFKDLQFLMIGPAWLLSFVYNKVGLKY